jgi:hypothetical protein
MKITTAALLVAGCLAATPLAAQTQTMPTPAAPSELDEDAPPRPIEGVAATYRTPVRDAPFARMMQPVQAPASVIAVAASAPVYAVATPVPPTPTPRLGVNVAALGE